MENHLPANSTVFEKGKHPMDVLLKQKSESSPLLREGDIVEGTVLEKKGSRLFVDLVNRGTGMVFGREYYAAQDMIKQLSVGDPVHAKVVDPDNEEGYVELSLKEAGREKDWQEMKRLMATAELIPLKVVEANRGGLILEYRGVPGFLPASQLSQEHYPRVEGGDKAKIFEALKQLVGSELEVAIIDVYPEEGKLIFSEKSREMEAARQRLAQYHVGDSVDGQVAGIVSFGAFVKFGDGLEGLVHISEIDWQLISSPTDVLKIAQHVQAKIIGIDGNKVSLSLKALKEDPWSKVSEKYRKGDRVTGVVVKFNPFGAFVKLDDDIQGLAHISVFGSEENMKGLLGVNQPHEFTVLSVDAREHRLALGLVTDETHPADSAVAASDTTVTLDSATQPPAAQSDVAPE